MKNNSVRLPVLMIFVTLIVTSVTLMFVISGFVSLAVMIEKGFESNVMYQMVQKHISITLFGFAAAVIFLCCSIVMVVRYPRKAYSLQSEFLLKISKGMAEIPENLPFTAEKDSKGMNGALGQFFSELRKFVLQIKNSGMQSQEIGEDLLKQSMQIEKQSDLIGQNAGVIQNKVVDLDEEIRDSETAVKDMHDYIQSVNQQIEEQSTAVNESSASIEELIASIKNIAKISETKGEQSRSLAEFAQVNEGEMRKTTEMVQRVSDSASVVLKMVEVLNDIVDQTDLLAMNAAIEAAHAGSYGHGFAVVASEIRKLAENARGQAKSMNENLKQVVQNVQSMAEISRGLEKSNHKMIEEIRQVYEGMQEMKNGTEEMSAGSDQISSALSNLVSSSGQLQQASKGMEEKLEVVEHSVGSLKELSKVNRESTSAISATIEDISRATSILGKIGEMNERNVGKLNLNVSRFSVRGNIIAENLPPYNFLQDGEPNGMAVDIAREMFRFMGKTAEIEFMRWEDAQRIASDTPDILLLTVFRSEDREPLFQWIGPSLEEQVQLFSLKDRRIRQIEKISERSELVLGVQRGNIEMDFFQTQGFAEGKNMFIFDDTSQMIQGLFSGKVDAIPLGKLQVKHQLQMMQRDPDELETIYSLKEQATDLYMTMSGKTDEGHIQKYRDAFRTLKQSGEYENILKRWS